ncbi:MAG TPA: anhydro-N-acetylmuramic acid kinase [Chryseolinea sp.]|nr:anhydro-N-acetylmuramic acid kinase [Chryseolinea sp.]
MDSKTNFKVIGLMSGTSLDGLDIAYCNFNKKKNGWKYSIKKADTLKYSVRWREKLSNAHLLSGEELMALDVEYGKFLGKACDDFVRRNNVKVDFIASHGHTIFHQPKKGFTLQIGNGNALNAMCGIPVIYDFRSLDVQLGGEGAPLVPVGDKFLFNEYDICLNLGGIANISMDVKGQRVAFDVCFINMGLNYLASKLGKTFDEDGRVSSTGMTNPAMLKELDQVYASLRNKRPSLGREIFEQRIKPILDMPNITLQDKLRTFTESSAKEIGFAIVTGKRNPKVLCTGGGTFNSFFVSCLLEYCGDQAALIIPEEDVVKFKEALVFSFLGVLRMQRQPNCLKSVTGAARNSCGGVLVGL